MKNLTLDLSDQLAIGQKSPDLLHIRCEAGQWSATVWVTAIYKTGPFAEKREFVFHILFVPVHQVILGD